MCSAGASFYNRASPEGEALLFCVFWFAHRAADACLEEWPQAAFSKESKQPIKRISSNLRIGSSCPAEIPLLSTTSMM